VGRHSGKVDRVGKAGSATEGASLDEDVLDGKSDKGECGVLCRMAAAMAPDILVSYQEKMSVEQTRKRLQELLDAYPHLEREATMQATPSKPIVAETELLDLYQAYHTWLVWHYALSQDLRQLVNFNLAEDVHKFALSRDSKGTKAGVACRKSEKGAKLATKAQLQTVSPLVADSAGKAEASQAYRRAMPEPVLEWLPPLLRTDGAPVDSKHYTPDETRDAIPLWSDDRLFAFLAAVPKDILRQHALARGLLGGAEADHAKSTEAKDAGIPRQDLAHGRGWFPVPTGAPWAQQVAMLSGEHPFQLPQLA